MLHCWNSLLVQAVVPLVPGSEQGVNSTVTTGAGKDTLDITLKGDAVDTIGESFALNAGKW